MHYQLFSYDLINLWPIILLIIIFIVIPIFISLSKGDFVKELPNIVKTEISKMDELKKYEFLQMYKRKSKSLWLSYFLVLTINLYYGYNRKWGYQIASWLTLGGFGLWILIDIFRMPIIVKNTNKDIAFELLRDFKIINNFNFNNNNDTNLNNGKLENFDVQSSNNNESTIKTWLKNNPGKTLNDYYKENNK